MNTISNPRIHPGIEWNIKQPGFSPNFSEGSTSSEALTRKLFQIQIAVAITQKAVVVVERMLVNALPVVANISRNEQ